MPVQAISHAPKRPAAEPLRFGFTLDDISRLTYTALRQDKDACRLDAADRFDAAWFGVVELLYAAAEPPGPGELINAGLAALHALSRDDRHARGLPESRAVRADGPRRKGTPERLSDIRPRFASYWIGGHILDPEPPFVGAVTDKVALGQVFAMLTKAEREALLALALHGDARHAAPALGLSKTAFQRRIDAARARFLGLWHQHETPHAALTRRRADTSAERCALRPRVAAVLTPDELPAVLLADARQVFDRLAADRMHSADLLARLAEDRPELYGAWDHADLKQALRACGVPPPARLTIGGVARTAYQRDQITDAADARRQARPDECDIILAAWLGHERARPDSSGVARTAARADMLAMITAAGPGGARFAAIKDHLSGRASAGSVARWLAWETARGSISRIASGVYAVALVSA
jgi:hypothetical protein